MKIAFLIEYFPPFATGGSEWSTYYLARQLSDLGIEIVVITPSYGEKPLQEKVSFKLINFPFYKKLKKEKLPGHFFYTNPLWIFYSAIAFLYFLKKEKIDLIHVQGKYSLPGARLANLILRKPIILTARDYQLICNYGICLYKGKKGCNIRQYFTNDFVKYYKDYVSEKSIVTLLLNFIYAIWGRISKNILKISAQKIKIVTLSNYQKIIYEANSFRNVEVIGNSLILPKLNYVKKQNKIVYVGRLTPGKGISLLIKIIPLILNEYPSYEIIFIGEGFLKEKIANLSKTHKRVKLLGQIDHDQTIKIIRQSKATIIPSLWPEPFGRVVIESLLSKTPVVVTKSGALPEIVDKRWGVVAKKSKEDLLSAIHNVLDNNQFFTKNISHDYEIIKKRFSSSVPEKYLNLYQEIVG